MPKCPRCPDDHDLIACPYIKAIEFEPLLASEIAAGEGLIRRLEFLTPADYGRAPASQEAEQDYPRLGGKK